MASRLLFIVVLSLAFVPDISAQKMHDLIFGQSKSHRYMGQYNYNGKRKNGFGAEDYKNGSFYIGNFSEGKITGRGMLISEKKGVGAFDNAVIYIGGFKDGKKDGKGACYDAKGNLIFQGVFKNNKPYDEDRTSSKKVFTMKKMKKNVYIGEYKGNAPNGYGIMLDANNVMVFGNYKNGRLDGVSMSFYGQDAWELKNWSNGKSSSIANSADANKDIAEFRAWRKQTNAEARRDFLEAGEQFAQAGLALADMISSMRSSGGSDASGSASASAGGGKGSSSRTCVSCKGTGVCNFCNGTGQSPMTTAGTNVHKNCTYCHGTKVCHKCHGKRVTGKGGDNRTISGGSVPSLTGNCKDCGGTGVCGECNGKGVYYVVGKATECWKCNGKRVCTTCFGK